MRNDNFASVNPLYSNATGGIDLQVLQDDAAEAMIILEQLDHIDIDIEKSKESCIYCGNHTLKYGYQEPEKVNIMSLLITIFSTVLPFLKKKKYHCYTCGSAFKKSELKNS